jgi:hypothetical protein
MSPLVILIALSVLVAAGAVVSILLTRRQRESMHATRHGSVHAESLLADLNDAQGRTERAARQWRQAVRRGGGRPARRE